MACKRCNGDHFNFVSCEQHAAKVAEQARRDRAPERFLRPREGERNFGHRLHSSQVNGSLSGKQGAEVVYIPRKEHPMYKES